VSGSDCGPVTEKGRFTCMISLIVLGRRQMFGLLISESSTFPS
jgi:hypothetical protein